jgi:hypothetical protein
MSLDRKSMRYLLAGILVLLSQCCNAAVVVDFEELALAPNSYFDGYGENAASGFWSSGGSQFNTNPFGPGWSYSNVNNPTTSGYLNSYAAFTGTGFGGDGNYALATSFFPYGAYINLPNSLAPLSMYITNTTYAATSMRDGDGFAKKFGGDSGDDPDFFRLIITGFDALDGTGGITGSTEFMLADFRDTNNALDYIVDQWSLVELASLGNARSIAFSMESSDSGPFGMNTPAFFAMDHMTLSAVPEPASIAWIGTIALCAVAQRWKRSVRGCSAHS